MFTLTSLVRFCPFLQQHLIYIYINLFHIRSHQPAIDLKSQHVPLQMGTRPLAAIIAVVSRPYKVIVILQLPCIDHQRNITAWGYLGLITSPHMVTLIHRSRHALFPLHKYFGLYYTLTNLYPSRHALSITKHEAMMRPLRTAVRSFQPDIDLRLRQVSLQIVTYLP